MATNRQNHPHRRRHGLLRLRMLIAVLSVAMAGCAGRGMIYKRVVEPYSKDFRSTPAGNKTCRMAEHILREPFSRANVSVSFTSRIVEESARAAGMTNLYYADMETIKILNGVYEKKTLIICGD